MGLIERHLGDRVTFPKSRSVNWRKNGPLGRKFRVLAQADFLKNEFSEESCFYEFLGIELTKHRLPQVDKG